ncbi:unnamed protein product [Rotaria sp. Silwood1]|nr:unnamed protein product [Rotaria sp. Silwood1]CAF1286326.1 unnamed protein product [Rotaria sp. Silwood1]
MDNDDLNMVNIDNLIVAAPNMDVFPVPFPFNEIERPIQLGYAEPLQIVDIPIVIDDQRFGVQTQELDGHHGEPAVVTPFAPNPTYVNIVDFDIEFSPTVQNVTDNNYIPYDPTLNYERETVAELVQNEDDNIQLLNIETIPIQIPESPAEIVPLRHEVHNDHGEHIDIMQLPQQIHVNEVTQVQLTAVVSPVTIDLTQNDNEVEDVHDMQRISNTDLPNNNVHINQLENNPPVPLVTAPSLEVTVPNPIVAAAVDNTHEAIHIDVHIQISTLSSQTHKRSNSSDAFHQTDKKAIPCNINRHRRYSS